MVASSTGATCACRASARACACRRSPRWARSRASTTWSTTRSTGSSTATSTPCAALIDQRVSRMINGYFGIVINTGEDNYLRTADALEAAPSVDGLAVHQPPARARLGRARRADRARRRVRDRPAGRRTGCCTSGRRRSSRASCSRTARSSTCRRRGTWTATCSARTPCDTLFNLDHDRDRPGHPDDRRADRGDLHAAHARPRDRPGERRLRVQRRARPRRGDRVQARRDHPDARAGGAAPVRTQLLERIAEVGLFAALERGRRSATSPRAIDEGRGTEGIVDDRRAATSTRRSS